MQTKSNTTKVVLTALMMCLIMIVTMFVRVPIPFTQGYVHLGDAMVFLAVLILGVRYGAVAAGFGAMLADIIGGFAAWAPWTFAIKGIMALIAYYTVKAMGNKKTAARIIGGIVAEVVMVLGYFVFEGFMYGFAPSAVNIPMNGVQGIAGLIVGLILIKTADKTRLI